MKVNIKLNFSETVLTLPTEKRRHIDINHKEVLSDCQQAASVLELLIRSSICVTVVVYE